MNQVDKAVDLCIENNLGVEMITRLNDEYISFNSVLQLTILISELYKKKTHLDKVIHIDDLSYDISSVRINLRNHQALIECYIQLLNPAVANTSDLHLEVNEGKKIAKHILKDSSFSNSFIDSLYEDNLHIKNEVIKGMVYKYKNHLVIPNYGGNVVTTSCTIYYNMDELKKTMSIGYIQEYMDSFIVYNSTKYYKGHSKIVNTSKLEIIPN
tara:strand:+ start:927 stop:1562 length:636 start_codon:yes stop_codon:yes gene_type:complete